MPQCTRTSRRNSTDQAGQSTPPTSLAGVEIPPKQDKCAIYKEIQPYYGHDTSFGNSPKKTSRHPFYFNASSSPWKRLSKCLAQLHTCSSSRRFQVCMYRISPAFPMFTGRPSFLASTLPAWRMGHSDETNTRNRNGKRGR